MEKYSKKFSPMARLKSIGNALRGLNWVIRHEHNARIHIFASGFVTATGLLLHINRVEWMLVLLCIGLVVTAEVFNTAIEKLVDIISPHRNEQARVIKDISAAAVLISAFVALVTGLLIFLPYLISSN